MTKQTVSGSAAAGIGLQDAYAVDGPEAHRERYALWARTYDSDFLAENDYVYHQHVTAGFRGGQDRLDELDGPMLDVGCGTGVVGAEPARLGVTAIDCIDISPEMLTKAAVQTHEGRSTYRQLLEADLTGRLEQRESAGQISGLDFELRPIYGGDDPDRWTRIAVFTVA